MPRDYYSGDPYWLTLKYTGKCAGCGEEIAKGEDAFRFKSGKLFGKKCGCGLGESERFTEAAEAEYAYSQGY